MERKQFFIDVPIKERNKDFIENLAKKSADMGLDYDAVDYPQFTVYGENFEQAFGRTEPERLAEIWATKEELDELLKAVCPPTYKLI